jgi:hypothetical protein
VSAAADDPRPWLTTAEAAERLRRKPACVLRWMRKGILPAAGPPLPDGGYLFAREAVDALALGGAAPARHASVEPDEVRAFIDAAWRRARGARGA